MSCHDENQQTVVGSGFNHSMDIPVNTPAQWRTRRMEVTCVVVRSGWCMLTEVNDSVVPKYSHMVMASHGKQTSTLETI